MEDHHALDCDPFHYDGGNARSGVSNTCAAFRQGQHFIGTPDRDNDMRQLSRGSCVVSNCGLAEVGGHRQPANDHGVLPKAVFCFTAQTTDAEFPSIQG
jgi:hypothetical protein